MRNRPLSFAIALLFAGQPAFAITAGELWQAWKDGLPALTAEREALRGDTLLIEGVMLKNGGDSLSLPKIVMTGSADGSVRVTFPEPITIDDGPLGADPAVRVSAPSATLIVSGTPDDARYELDAPEITLETAEATENLTKLAISLRDATGKFDQSGEDLTWDVAAKTITLDMGVKDELTGTITGTQSGLSVTGSMRLPDDYEEKSLPEAVSAGLLFDLMLKTGSGDMSMAFNAPDGSFRLGMTMNDSSATVSLDEKDLTVAQTMNGLDFTSDMTFAIDVPEAFGLATTSSVKDVSWTTGMTLPVMMLDGAEPKISDGLLTDNSVRFDAVNIGFKGNGSNGAGEGRLALSGGDARITLDPSGLLLSVSQRGFDLFASSPEFPVPEIGATLAEAGVSFAFPAQQSDTPQPFAFDMKIVDLNVSDPIWNLLDPAGTFERGPVTTILDVDGRMRLLVPLDELERAQDAGEPTAEIHAFDLTELTLKGLGAEVTGGGGVTFDNGDVITFSGVPRPDGTVTFNASGITTLLGKIEGMGLVSPDELTGIRMGLSMFAKPGEAEDTLTSRIEFRDGGFFLNGVKMR